MPMTSNDKIRLLYKPAVWVLCLLPIFWLGWLLANKDLTANPAEFTNQYLGGWAIRFLWVALAVTPVVLITGWKNFVRFRRLIGLFSFFYVVLHVTSYVALDQGFDWLAIYNDIVKRVYITIGAVASIILIILAATSSSFMVKYLGSRIWKKVHQSAYIAGTLAVTHFIMMRKGFQIEPLIYTGILIMLFGTRVGFYFKKRNANNIVS